MAKRIQAILSLRDDFSKALERAKEQNARFNTAWQTTGKNIDRVGNKMQKAGDKMANAFTKPIKAVGVLGATVAGLGAKIGFTEALDLQGYRQQLNTATKDTKKAAQIMQDAVEMANATPFEAGELVQAAAMFESMGMSADKWLTLTGDMAAATNKSFDQATEALIDAQTGELERLKEFGITKAMIAEQANKMFADQQVINNQGQIVDQEKFNEAMIALMKDKYSGGMEAQAKTIRGMWSTVTGVTKSAMATMLGMTSDGSVRAGSALDIIGEKVGNVAAKFDQWQTDGTIERWAASFDSSVQNVMAVAGPVFGTIGGLVKSAAEWFFSLSDGQQKAFIAAVMLVGGLGPMISLMGSLVGVVGSSVAPFMRLVTTFGSLFSSGSLFIKVIKSIATFLGPGGIFIAAVLAAIAIGVKLCGGWDNIKKKGMDAFKTVKTWVDNAKNAVGDLWQMVKDFLADSALGRLASSVGGVISSAREKFGSNATGTAFWRGGLTAVHERGGEIIDLPRGTRIYPHERSVQMAYQAGQGSGGSIAVSFSGAQFVVREEADIDRIAQAIVKRLQIADRNRRG